MSQSEGKDEWVMDDQVKEEVSNVLSEEEIIGMYHSGGEGEQRMPIVKSWFPDEDQIKGKTIVTKRQAKQLALARHIPKAFSEVSPLEGFIEGVINDYEMLLTSVEGIGREQQTNVLRSLFGGGSEQVQEVTSTLLGMASMRGNEEDND